MWGAWDEDVVGLGDNQSNQRWLGNPGSSIFSGKVIYCPQRSSIEMGLQVAF